MKGEKTVGWGEDILQVKKKEKCKSNCPDCPDCGKRMKQQNVIGGFYCSKCMRYIEIKNKRERRKPCGI